jgi:hypothetical protein
MKGMPITALSGLLMLSMAPMAGQRSAGSPLQEEELMLRVRSTRQNCDGASAPTRSRLMQQFMDDVAFKDVEIKSALVIGFTSESGLGEKRPGKQAERSYGVLAMDGGFFVDLCSTSKVPFGQVVLPESEPSQPLQPKDFLERARKSLGPGGSKEQPYQGLRLEKSYQDANVSYMLFVPRGVSLDDVRVGQKLTLTLRVLNVAFRAAPPGMTGMVGEVHAVPLKFSPETTMLKCANDHQYAPSSGYKFCPIDGLPLK